MAKVSSSSARTKCLQKCTIPWLAHVIVPSLRPAFAFDCYIFLPETEVDAYKCSPSPRFSLVENISLPRMLKNSLCNPPQSIPCSPSNRICHSCARKHKIQNASPSHSSLASAYDIHAWKQKNGSLHSDISFIRPSLPDNSRVPAIMLPVVIMRCV